MIRAICNIFRLIRIAAILLRYDVCCFRKKGARQGERIAKALERLGPSFIKLGQAISTRSDLIGEEVANDLASLRDRLPPFPSQIAREIIETEFGKTIDELFAYFSDQPIAAASIAQVHKAVTKDGKLVAVKILRPDIEKSFKRDIELFFWIADILAKRLPSRLKPRAIIQTFKDSVFFELDLRFEAAAADELADNLKKSGENIIIPTTYWEMVSKRIMTSDFIEGISFGDIKSIRASGFDVDEILKKIANSIFTQIFIDGFFHADLHPGNLFLDKKNGELAMVDFGIMGRLDHNSRLYIAGILHGFLNADYRTVAKLHFSAGYVPENKSLEAFTQACKAVAQPIIGKPLNEISVAKLLAQMFSIASEFEMEVQPQLLLMQKTLMVAEGLGRMLNPSLNMWELARPLIESWAKENFSKSARIKHAANEAREHLRKLPKLLSKLEKALIRELEN